MPRNLPKSVLLLHNEPESANAGHESVAGVLDQVRAVEKALVSSGVMVERVGVRDLAEAGRAITRSTAPVVFNLVEAFTLCNKTAHRGRSALPRTSEGRAGRLAPLSVLGDSELVPAICRAFGKGVTGNDTSALLLTLDKWITKLVLQAAGIPTPPGVLIHKHADRDGTSRLQKEKLPPPPWIVKPVSSDASEGITCESVINGQDGFDPSSCKHYAVAGGANPSSRMFPGGGRRSVGATSGPALMKLQKQIARIHKDFGVAALVESCVGDREINVSLFQTGKMLTVLPLAEIDFTKLRANEPHIVDYTAKWHTSSHRYKATRRVVPAKIPEPVARRIRALAKSAWVAMGCRHYARVDMRLSHDGTLHVLEVNANPDISPDAGFVAALEAGGLSFKAFVRALVVDACRMRYIADSESRPTSRKSLIVGRVSHPARLNQVAIRRSRVSDRVAVEKLLDQPAYFKPHEIAVGLEVLDDAHKGGASGHYQSFVSIHKGKVTGWVCYGPTPCTEGTFDIYWIAVAPDMQGRGIGSALVRYAEARMVERAGRMNLLETAGRPDYEPTRRFYRSLGYNEVSRIPDFYAPGDDKVTFAKRLCV